MSKHSATATTRCRHNQLHSSSTAHKMGSSVLLDSITQGTQKPWQLWSDTPISIYPDYLAFRAFWKGANTLPGIENLLVYLEVQI